MSTDKLAFTRSIGPAFYIVHVGHNEAGVLSFSSKKGWTFQATTNALKQLDGQTFDSVGNAMHVLRSTAKAA